MWKPPNLRVLNCLPEAPLLCLDLSSASQPCRPRVTLAGVRQAREREITGGLGEGGERRSKPLTLESD